MTARDHLTPLNIALAVLIVATTAVGFALIPPGGTLPVHWGPTGAADGYVPRDAALLLLPGLAIVVSILLIFVRRFGNPEASRSAIGVAVSACLALFLVLHVAIVMIGLGMAVDMVRVVVLATGAMLVVIGNVLPKTQPNPVAGIRLPWTMRDPANWQATNRLGGLLLMIAGVAIVVTALLVATPQVLLVVLLGALGLSIVITTLYSWRLSRLH
jgi:uncharacterized membrane protein